MCSRPACHGVDSRHKKPCFEKGCRERNHQGFCWQSQRKVAVKSPAAEENVRCSRLWGRVESTRRLACVTAQGNPATAEQTTKEWLQKTPCRTVFFIALFLFALASEIAGEWRVSKVKCGVRWVSIIRLEDRDGKRSRTGSDGTQVLWEGRGRISRNERGGVVPCSLRRLEGGSGRS